jgi:hypothetical protein
VPIVCASLIVLKASRFPVMPVRRTEAGPGAGLIQRKAAVARGAYRV